MQLQLFMKTKRLLALSSFFVCAAFALSIGAVSAQVNEKEFPDQKSYSSVSSQGKKIGEDLCKKTKKDKATCVDEYKQEYIFLAHKKCANDKSCYTNFVNKNKKIGQARKAAGYPSSKKVNYSGTMDDFKPAGSEGKYQCGKGDTTVNTKFNFGCLGDESSEDSLSPIMDIAYAIIRFLSIGVGIAVVASIIYAGIQYSASQGSPEETQAAKNRIQNAIIALIFYMFIYAIVQFLVPGGLFGAAIPTLSAGGIVGAS
jgi:hypothetical protein